MPDELSSAFRLKYNLSKEDLLDTVYRKPRPNAYLADYTKFAAEFQQHPFIVKLIENCFQDFFENHINGYKKYQNVNLHFTGSIAVVFSPTLKKVAIKNGFEFVDILASPIENLVKYHNS